MNPAPIDTLQAVQALHELGHELYWLIFPIIFFTVVEGFIVELAGGVLFRFRSGHHNDEIVMVDGEWARVTRLGIFSTTMYTYILRDDKVIGGYSMTILNDELRHMKIKRPLDLVSVPSDLQKITQ